MVKDIDPRFHIGTGTLSPNVTGMFLNLINITQGALATQRQGADIKVTKIIFKCYVANADDSNVVRLILFHDKQPYG